MASTLLHKRIAPRKLMWVGPLTILATAIANLIIRAIAVTFLGISGSFQDLQTPIVIGSTIVYVMLALLAFLLVSRFARRPIRFYRVLALISLCVSFLSPIMALAGLLPAPGMNLSIFWVMLAMHSLSAIIVVALLTTLASQQA